MHVPRLHGSVSFQLSYPAGNYHLIEFNLNNPDGVLRPQVRIADRVTGVTIFDDSMKEGDSTEFPGFRLQRSTDGSDYKEFLLTVLD